MTAVNTKIDDPIKDKINMLKNQTDEEMHYKNNLYFFILEMGLFFELQEFEFTHDLSYPDCPRVSLPDPLTRAKREFEIEHNIKNNLRAFAIRHNLARELQQYENSHDMISPTGQLKAVTGAVISTPKLKRSEIEKDFNTSINKN